MTLVIGDTHDLPVHWSNASTTRPSDLLAKWKQTWQMEFDPSKCQVLSITRNRKVINYPCNLHGHVLEHVNEAKYLGITMSSDLRCNKHISNICNNANRTLGFLWRNLKLKSPKLKETAYNTLVHPMVEYTPSVWDPHTQACINQVEMVQSEQHATF